MKARGVIVPRLLVLLSAGLFAASLTQESFCTGSCTGWPGFGVLGFGWIEPIALSQVGPFVAFSWYANPCLGLALVFTLSEFRRLALTFAGAGLVLGAAFLLGKSVWVSESGADAITGHALGYWLWVASLAVAFVAAAKSPRRVVTAEGRLRVPNNRSRGA
jgi:hypothetical protein